MGQAGDTTLVFVYNADSGWRSALSDLLHKTLSPSTYPCDLCALTYGLGGMRREWARFIRGLGVSSVFTYRDALPKEFPMISAGELPAVFRVEGQAVMELIRAEEFSALKTLEQIMEILARKLERRPLDASGGDGG